MKSTSLRPAELGAIAALAAIAVAVVVGFLYGIELSVLVLATGALGLVIASLWASVRNLTGDTPLTLDEALGLGAPSAEEEQKRAVLRALKDLEYERSVGKISEADYRDYSARYREEARRLMERVDASLAKSREIAEQLANERVAADELSLNESEAERAQKSAGKKPSTVRAEVDADEDEGDTDESDSDDTDDDEDADSDRSPAREHAEANEKASKRSPSTPDEDTKEAKSETAICSGCQGSNDADAKFCKHCGASIHGPARSTQSPGAREENTP